MPLTPRRWRCSLPSSPRRLVGDHPELHPEFCFRFGGSSWKAQDALRFIEASGGRLTTISPDQLRYVRSQLLDAPADDFGWLLRWLRKAKNCEPAIYSELTSTSAMREKIKALTDGTRYLSPSQKLSRANQRRRRAAERKQEALRAQTGRPHRPSLTSAGAGHERIVR